MNLTETDTTGRKREEMGATRAWVAGLLAAGAVAGATALSGCSAEPEKELVLGAPEVSAQGTPMPSAVEADVEKRYSEALAAKGVRVRTEDIAPAARVSDIRAGAVDVTFGCVGEILDGLDATKAEQLRELYAKEKDPDPARWRDIVHSSMLGSLPADVGASDPGIAQPCPRDGLPQNLVALYNKEAIDRWDRTDLNNIAGGVTDDMIGVERS